jgi:hypothetical protein
MTNKRTRERRYYYEPLPYLIDLIDRAALAVADPRTFTAATIVATRSSDLVVNLPDGTTVNEAILHTFSVPEINDAISLFPGDFAVIGISMIESNRVDHSGNYTAFYRFIWVRIRAINGPNGESLTGTGIRSGVDYVFQPCHILAFKRKEHT